MEPPGYCEVALTRPVLRTFTYRLPPPLGRYAHPGSRVLVPFGKREMIGIIDALKNSAGRTAVKSVLEILDEEPIFPDRLLHLCRWVADYYVAPLGLMLRAALPPGLLTETSYRVRLLVDPAGVERKLLSSAEAALVSRLAEASGPLRPATLRDAVGSGSVWPTLRALRQHGLVEIETRAPAGEAHVLRQRVLRITQALPTLTAREQAFGRARRQREAYEILESMGGTSPTAQLTGRLGFSASVLTGLVEKKLAELTVERVVRDPLADLKAFDGSGGNEIPLEPTPAQAAVIAGLRSQACLENPGVALLRGVTGSGKTLIYLELMEELVMRGGRSAILLVPEISLTPQTVAVLRARFGEIVAVLHSGLSAGERYDEWRALREGKKRIAVGARSAIFAPVRELGLIVVDEEHEGTFKQSETPRYQARAVAAVRARLEQCLCLLGSATPSLESWARAEEGSYRLYELPDRVTGQPLPRVQLVDMRERGAPVFSDPLREAVANRLDRGEQVILFLNRRGYATFVQCEACGKVWSCERCSISLTYHRQRRRVVCHQCGYEAEPPERCDECPAPDLSYTGLGTEQVERKLGELFPDARLARMDLDTTGTKWAHLKILERVRRREVDILLGTQMIAKGLDFPAVTLVGVINADVGLNLPDFRASERTFQLLAQVAGRAGRGAEPGEVLIQTYRPHHIALQSATTHDFLAFVAHELRDRREAGYPPYRRLANLVISGSPEVRVADAALGLAKWTRGLLRDRTLAGMAVVGPAPCPIERLRGRWRWHFLLKADRAGAMGSVLRYLAERQEIVSGKMRLEIDRDPEALL